MLLEALPPGAAAVLEIVGDTRATASALQGWLQPDGEALRVPPLLSRIALA
jgi:hypothetical protein